jgi:hypothetical protein
LWIKSYGELIAKAFPRRGNLMSKRDEEDVLGDTLVDEDSLDFEAGAPEDDEDGDVSPHEVAPYVDSLAAARAAEWDGQDRGGLE